MHTGIDYGHGLTNVDLETGIRYGCISQHSLLGDALNEFENEYGEPTCPSCGTEIDSSDDVEARLSQTDEDGECMPEWFDGKDFACIGCEQCYWSDAVYGDEPIGRHFEDREYTAVDCLDSDVLVIKSPFYTFGPFCSPCVPGAISLDRSSEYDEGTLPNREPRAYCFGHDWFEGGKAPYRVFRVNTNQEVFPE